MNGKVGGTATLPHHAGMQSICSSKIISGIATRVHSSIGGAPSRTIAAVNLFLNTTMNANVMVRSGTSIKNPNTISILSLQLDI
jgi:hypothetical protein